MLCFLCVNRSFMRLDQRLIFSMLTVFHYVVNILENLSLYLLLFFGACEL